MILFNLLSSTIAKKFDEEKKYLINPYVLISGNNSDHLKLINELFTKKEFICPYSSKDYEELNLNCLDKLKSNKNLLKDYYNDTKCYIKEVAKGIKK